MGYNGIKTKFIYRLSYCCLIVMNGLVEIADFYERILRDQQILQRIMAPMLKAINNPNRKRILQMLLLARKQKRRLTITDIHKKLGIAYKNTHSNVEILRKAGFVKLLKNPNAPGQAVTVELDYPQGAKTFSEAVESQVMAKSKVKAPIYLKEGNKFRLMSPKELENYLKTKKLHPNSLAVER